MSLHRATARRPGAFRPTGAVASVFVLLAAAAPALAVPCSRAGTLGANLLVPYFEVDLDSAEGPTTLFSIGNATSRARLTEVTVWSDWGIPVFSFVVHLGADAVQTINLRDVVALRLPSLAGADPDDFPGCDTPPPPELTAADLQARLTGAPASDGLCYGRARGERRIAVGFVTVDFASSCDAALAGTGAKTLDDDSDANIFYGDVFYVDPSQASAQGMPAIGIRYDPDSGGYLPTDSTWRARFLSGGAIGAETEVIVWIGRPSPVQQGVECGSSLSDLSDFTASLFYSVRSGPERGPLSPSYQTTNYPRGDLRPALGVTDKLPLATLLPGDRPAGGVLELETWEACVPCPIIPPSPSRYPSIVWPIYRADGKFSVGLEATPLGSCGPE